MSRHHKLTSYSVWERLRRQVLDRDGRRCQQCGGVGKFEIHHLIPLSKGGTNDLGNLTTLCRSCHINAHKKGLTESEKAWQALVRDLHRA